MQTIAKHTSASARYRFWLSCLRLRSLLKIRGIMQQTQKPWRKRVIKALIAVVLVLGSNTDIVRGLQDKSFAASLSSLMFPKKVTGVGNQKFLRGLVAVTPIDRPLSMMDGNASIDSSSDGCEEGSYAHSKLPINQRSLFVRIAGLIDSRLSCDTVTGNFWLATGVTWLFCLIGGFGVWRAWNGKFMSGIFLMLVPLICGPALFMLP